MRTLEQRGATMAHLIAPMAHLMAQLRELKQLREQVRKAELAARSRRIGRRERRLSRRLSRAKSIRKSSICLPNLSRAANKRGNAKIEVLEAVRNLGGPRNETFLRDPC
jgi:hypothetical protein